MGKGDKSIDEINEELAARLLGNAERGAPVNGVEFLIIVDASSDQAFKILDTMCAESGKNPRTVTELAELFVFDTEEGYDDFISALTSEDPMHPVGSEQHDASSTTRAGLPGHNIEFLGGLAAAGPETLG